MRFSCSVSGVVRCIVLAALLVPGLSKAGEGRPGGEASGLNLTLGGGAIVLPRYSGADSYRVRPAPFIDARYRDSLFFNPFSGLGWNAIRTEHFRAGPVLLYAGGRRGSGALSDTRSVRGGVAAGGFMEYRLNGLRLDADVRFPMTGDVNGYRATAGVRHDHRIGPWLTSIGPTLVYRSASSANSIYGLDERDAAALGVGPYRAGSGLTEVRLQGRLTYLFNRQWSLTTVAGVGRLLNDAKDSPIVDDLGSANEGYLGVVLAYTFRSR
ncbi:MipA/OmpV family protein [Methylonatrum kenyense]|uniref:MipA/OmpV family protein n=1 Tax=Methylonatrum kenyense TaxID=455253 RepID=UPI0020BDB56C|nr:MipA/OmpV family protein [Methylonatrum kenyense]MCK8516218.1 MipA/OmpV family protein [Methylonatrum kenyense]